MPAAANRTADLSGGVDRALLEEELKLSCSNVMLQCFEPQDRCVFILGTMFKVDSRVAAEMLEMTPRRTGSGSRALRKRMAAFLGEYCGLAGGGALRAPGGLRGGHPPAGPPEARLSRDGARRTGAAGLRERHGGDRRSVARVRGAAGLPGHPGGAGVFEGISALGPLCPGRGDGTGGTGMKQDGMLEFLAQLAANNSLEWMHAHKRAAGRRGRV